MDLGLILELGNRTRLVVLGRVLAILPTEKHDLLRLQMNALGVIDFDQRTASLDAVLYDSRLVGKFPITGSMAMRMNWGSSPQFALSVGGFHPAFKPPAKIPGAAAARHQFQRQHRLPPALRVLHRPDVEHAAIRRSHWSSSHVRRGSASRVCSAMTC